MKLNFSAVLFGFGVYLIWFLPVLPGLVSLCLTLPISLLALKYTRLLPLGVFILGLSWGIYQCHKIHLSQVVDAPQGVDFQIIGVVSDLPQDRGISQRFAFRVESYRGESDELNINRPQKILISWYRYDDQIQVGDRLSLTVRLCRPRGLSNFAQFDYQRWLLGNGFDATGYIRSGSKIGISNLWVDRINRYRSLVSLSIQELGLKNFGLISALGLGLKSDIEQNRWDLFTSTGVIHLMVISGLHIGFAGLIGFYFGGVISKPLLWLGLLKSDVPLRMVATIVFASFYAVLAGLSLPVLRALIMLLVWLLSRAFKLQWSGWTALSLAFAVIAFLQPTAVLQNSFWMSFGAVLVLVVSMSGRPSQGGLTGLVRAQAMLLCGFGGLLLCLGNSVYLASLFANLLAVPYTGLVLVPIILIAMLSMPLAPGFSELLLQLADMGLSLLLSFLELLSSLSLPVILPVNTGFGTGVLVCISGLLLVGIPSVYLRIALASILLPLTLGVKTESPQFSLLVFDVGQGTAVLIEQPGYRLLYDTGPAFSAQFNAGADILLPHLTATSNHLHTLVVSHDDADHSGGLDPILSNLDIDEVYVGGSDMFSERKNIGPTYCAVGKSWREGQVEYKFPYPPRSASGKHIILTLGIIISPAYC